MDSRVESPLDYRLLFEAAPGPYLILAVDAPRFTIVAVNDAYLRATMTAREDVIGRGLFEVFPDPPDEPTATGTRNLQASLGRAIATKAPDRMPIQHYDIRRPDGEWEERHWSPINVPLVNDQGTVAHIIHHVEDVTARVRAEREIERLGIESLARADHERVREQILVDRERLVSERDAGQRRLLTVLEQSPMAIIVVGAPSGRVLFANHQVQSLFPDVLAPDRLEASAPAVGYDASVPSASVWAQPLVRAIRQGENTVSAIVPVPGTDREVSITAAPVRDGDARIIAGVAIYNDVTDQRRAESELQRARLAAEAASRAKSEFLAVMSHELRTPLNAIGGYLQLIQLGLRGPVTEQQIADLGKMQLAQERLVTLIEDILNFTRLEAHGMPYIIESVPVNVHLASLEVLIGPQVRAKQIQYAYVPCDPATAVCADRQRFSQIMLNLLSNAIKFTSTGGRVTIDCEIEAPVVRVHVRDTGCGIAADMIASIFEPFVQVEQGLTRRNDGVGLGLSISRTLARDMNGDLYATSVVGEGSQFTLELPLANAASHHRPRRSA